MNQIAFQREGRHLIFDCFLCVRRRFSNRHPYLLKNLLNILWEPRDIFVDSLGCCLISLHVFSFVVSVQALDPPLAQAFDPAGNVKRLRQQGVAQP